MRRLRAFAGDARGNVAIMAALLFTVVFGFTAFGVDLGKVFNDRRRAQGAADLAAIAAAADLANAGKAAAATVAANAYAASVVDNVTVGIYTPDSSLAPAARFKPSAAASANAARVTLRTTTDLLFGKLLIGKERLAIETHAVATQTAFAAFSIGSGLATVDGGLINRILGGLIGSSLSLSAMDYQALANARLDLFKFSSALSTKAHITAGTYGELANTTVPVAAVLSAMAETQKTAAGATDTAAMALASIADAARSAAGTVKLSQLFDFGPYASLALGQAPQVSVAAAALHLVSAAAQLANGAHIVTANLDLNVPGIAAATLKLAVGEPPQGTSWTTVGPIGASVHTAQTRVLLTVQLLGGSGIGAVRLPIYLELASGSATLSTLKCGYPDIAASTMTLMVKPAVLDGWIGNVTDAAMTNFTTTPNPPAAPLIDLAILKVTGRAHAAITNLAATPVGFGYADIRQQTRKTVSTTDYIASLLASLIGDLDLKVSLIGLPLGLPPNIEHTVTGIVAAAAGPLDRALAKVLGALGISLGQATVWSTGIRCDGAVLVN